MSLSENKIKINDLVLWIALAFFLRLIFMFIAAHPDIIYINYYPSKLAYEGVFDVYKYKDMYAGSEMWTYYPPLTYFVLGGFQFIFKLFNPGFHQWIQTVYFKGLGQWLLINGTSFNFFKYLFLMKLPYAAFDALAIFVIWRYLDDSRLKMRAVRLWCLNPVILYGTYMFGGIDIIPASLVACSVLLIKRRKAWWGLLLLGVAALFKTFSIFMILPFFIILTYSKKDFFKNIAAIALPFMLVLVPFFISSRGLVISSLFPAYSSESAGLLGTLCFFAQRAVFMGLYFILIFSCFRPKKTADGISVLGVSISVLMLVYIIFFVPIHYFTWVIPLLIIGVCLRMVPQWLYWLQIFCLFIYNLNSPKTTTALLAPINPQFFLDLPGLPDLMHNLSVRWGVVMLAARLTFVTICVLIAMGIIGQIPAVKQISGIRDRQ